MNNLIRAAALTGYPALAASLGLDVDRQLRRVGLSPASLDDPDGLIPYGAMIDLLERAAADAGCGDFGLRLSQRQGLDTLGPMAVVIEHSATVGQAIAMASRYMYVHSPAIRLQAEPVPGRADAVDLCYAIDLPGAKASVQAVELALGLIVQGLRQLGRGEIRVHQVMLPHPRCGPAASYARLLHERCHFDQPRAAVRLAAADLDRAMPQSSAMMRALAQTYMDTRFAVPQRAFSDRVRLLVQQLLGTGRASHAVVAQMLAIHPRTMQRRLGEEGLTFEQLKDGLRRSLFEELVARPDAPSMAQLAARLDYAEASALTRSCRRWFGVSPMAFRQARLAAGAGLPSAPA